MIVSYTCPHCRAQLETESRGWDGWVRCPVCARVSLPPAGSDSREAGERLAAVSEDVAITPEANGLPVIPGLTDDRSLAIPLRASHTSPARLIFTTGLVLSLVLSLIFFLDYKPRTTAIFGFMAICFFLMLLRTPRKKVAPWGTWRK